MAKLNETQYKLLLTGKKQSKQYNPGFMKTMIVVMLTLQYLLPMASRAQIDSDALKRKSASFELEIPKLENGKPPSYYLNKHRVEHLMGLQSLENGFDSMQLRFWYGYARTDSSQLVVITRKNQQWSAHLFTFMYVMGDSGKITPIKKDEREGSPKFEWKRFSQALFKLSVSKLPDEYSIPNYPEYTDGNSIMVEVATKNYYRIYSYKEPMMAQTQVEDARKIEQALILIEDQFGFRRLRQF